MVSIFSRGAIRLFLGAASKKPYQNHVLLREMTPNLPQNSIHATTQKCVPGPHTMTCAPCIFSSAPMHMSYETTVQWLGPAGMAAAAPRMSAPLYLMTIILAQDYIFFGAPL